MSISLEFINVDISDGIAIVTINREEKLNALNKDVLRDLKTCFGDLKNNKEVSGVILTGAGEKSFVAGADIGSMSDMSPADGKEFAEFGQSVTLEIEHFPKPVIAAVGGYALGGGCEIALSADFILATENALFGLPEVSLGLIPGFGGTQRLAKVIGRNHAKKLIYTGQTISAEQALNMGLALEVFPTKDLMIQAATKILMKTQKNSPFAIGEAKKVINQGADLSIEEGLALESNTFGSIFSSFDMKEGTKAFVEKRKPQFKGE